MTEPQGSADIENMDVIKVSTIETTAVLDGDEWIINGHKLWPTNSGGICSLFGVVCTTNPGSRDLNNFAFIFVPADKNGDVWFDHFRVPKHYRACDIEKHWRDIKIVQLWMGGKQLCRGFF